MWVRSQVTTTGAFKRTDTFAKKTSATHEVGLDTARKVIDRNTISTSKYLIKQAICRSGRRGRNFHNGCWYRRRCLLIKTKSMVHGGLECTFSGDRDGEGDAVREESERDSESRLSSWASCTRERRFYRNISVCTECRMMG